jgi:hypothetical protein
VEKRPKIKVIGPGWSERREPLDFDEARLLPFCQDILISVEGRVVASFAELEQMAVQKPYQSRDYLEITLLPIMVGG